jgi:hypothetical protein
MSTILARPGVLVGVVAMNLARLADGVGTAGIGEADGALRPLGEAGEGVEGAPARRLGGERDGCRRRIKVGGKGVIRRGSAQFS